MAQAGLISTREGLSNRFVTAITQEYSGLIWIGTRNGLNCYDGYVFNQYFSHSRELTLSNPHIRSLLSMPDGSIVVATDIGLNLVSAGRDKDFVVKKMLSHKSIITMCHAGKGKIAAGSSDGEIILTGPGVSPNVIYSTGTRAGIKYLISDEQQNIWFTVSGRSGIYKLTAPLYNQLSAYLEGQVNMNANFLVDGETLIVAHKNKKGIGLFNVKQNRIVHSRFIDSLNRTPKEATYFFKDRAGCYWVGYNYGGLFKLNMQRQLAVDYSRYFNRSYFGSKINVVFEDQDHMIWAGTDGGFVKIPQSISHFRTFLVNDRPENEDAYMSIRGMADMKNGQILLSSYKGFFMLDPQHKTLRRVPGDDGPLAYHILHDSGDHALLATFGNGVIRLNTQTGKQEQILQGRSGDDIFTLFRDHDNRLWLGTNKGLWRYDPLKKTALPYHQIDQLQMQSISFITEHPRNTLWLGTNNGLYQVNIQTNVFKHYHTNSIPSLSNNEILSLAFTSDSVLWLGSKGGGLMKMNIVSETVTPFNTEDGLSNNIVYCMSADSTYLWLSTENGISKLNMKTLQFRNYFEKDGISSNEFNTGSMLEADNGKVYFGGVNGITSFDPSNFPDPVNKPYIILTSFSKSNEDIPFERNIPLPPIDLNLPHNDNLLLRFALTDYYQPQFSNFYYKIEGIDHTWINLNTQNFLRLNHLPAGSYTLLIKGRNMNGFESRNQVQVNLHVAQVFYKRGWFIAGAVTLITLVTLAAFRLRIAQLLALQKLRTKIARDLHDEVGSMLTRISILTELLKYKNQHNPEIEQIAEASRQATNTMSDVLWSVDARNDKMGNLVDRMREHADSLLQPLDISIHFEAEGLDMNCTMNMQTRQNLLMILKEAIHNIAKHSNATQVNILLRNGNNHFKMVISDNGTTPSLNRHGSGQGLKNMQLRATEIKAKLTIDTTNGYTIYLTHKQF